MTRHGSFGMPGREGSVAEPQHDMELKVKMPPVKM